MIQQPLLSILIPSTPDRTGVFNTLLRELEKQCNGITDIGVYQSGEIENIFTHYFHNGVTATIYIDSKILTIGEKRERLYNMAKGTYSWQIDSDDFISPNAIELILNAIKSNPEVDAISFEEFIDIDGKIMKSNHSNDYSCWEGDGSKLLEDGYHFHRTIFFKDVIRTELAKSVPIVHCRFGEDNLYADALKPFIKSEFHINQELYKYIHRSSDFNERYGIK